jgi:nucleoside-diphosphate-sugar epimerase
MNLEVKKRILIVGAGGFIGKDLVAALKDKGYLIRATYNKKNVESPLVNDNIIVTDVTDDIDYTSLLNQVDTIIYLVGKNHNTNPFRNTLKKDFFKSNFYGAIKLAQKASQMGVRRFIYLSSIKAIGDVANIDTPYSILSEENPRDWYGKSKLKAEKYLLELARNTSIEVVCLRPVLVYGNEVKGNLRALMHAFKLGLPLPLAGIMSHRSLLAKENLIDLIVLCISHNNAKNKIFLVADDDQLTISDIANILNSGVIGRNLTFQFPSSFFSFINKFLHKLPAFQKLFLPLVVDIEETKSVLGWRPRIKSCDGLRKMAELFLK